MESAEIADPATKIAAQRVPAVSHLGELGDGAVRAALNGFALGEYDAANAEKMGMKCEKVLDDLLGRAEPPAEDAEGDREPEGVAPPGKDEVELAQVLVRG